MESDKKTFKMTIIMTEMGLITDLSDENSAGKRVQRVQDEGIVFTATLHKTGGYSTNNLCVYYGIVQQSFGTTKEFKLDETSNPLW